MMDSPIRSDLAAEHKSLSENIVMKLGQERIPLKKKVLWKKKKEGSLRHGTWEGESTASILTCS